jgi:hypothetical protein
LKAIIEQATHYRMNDGEALRIADRERCPIRGGTIKINTAPAHDGQTRPVAS